MSSPLNASGLIYAGVPINACPVSASVVSLSGPRAVEARAHQLQGHGAPHRLALLGEVDGSHAPFAEELDQAIAADPALVHRRWRMPFWWRRPGARSRGLGQVVALIAHDSV